MKNRCFSDIYWWNDRFQINRHLKSINRLQKKIDSNSISFWISETSFPSWIESSIQLRLSRSISNQSTKDKISRFEKFKSFLIIKSLFCKTILKSHRWQLKPIDARLARKWSFWDFSEPEINSIDFLNKLLKISNKEFHLFLNARSLDQFNRWQLKI